MTNILFTRHVLIVRDATGQACHSIVEMITTSSIIRHQFSFWSLFLRCLALFGNWISDIGFGECSFSHSIVAPPDTAISPDNPFSHRMLSSASPEGGLFSHMVLQIEWGTHFVVSSMY